MNRHDMTDERIFELIDAYGADPHAFPEAERDAVRKRLAEAPGLFAAALEQARSLDTMLARLPEPAVPEALRASILAAAPQAPKPAATGLRGRLFGRLPNWIPAGAVASLAMGLLIGVNVSVPASMATASTDDADTVMYAALGFDDYSLINEGME